MPYKLFNPVCRTFSLKKTSIFEFPTFINIDIVNRPVIGTIINCYYSCVPRSKLGFFNILSIL